MMRSKSQKAKHLKLSGGVRKTVKEELVISGGEGGLKKRRALSSYNSDHGSTGLGEAACLPKKRFIYPPEKAALPAL